MANHKKYVLVLDGKITFSSNDFDKVVDERDRNMEGHIMEYDTYVAIRLDMLDGIKELEKDCTRVEVIDKDAGRIFVRSGKTAKVQFQDGHKTVKIFLGY